MAILPKSSPSAASMPLVTALLPSNCPEIFGEQGATPDYFRYSRSKQRYVLDRKKVEESTQNADFADTAPVGEAGIMQQAELTNLHLLLNEIAYFQRSPSGEFARLADLLRAFQESNHLVGSELEEVREELESFISKRPNEMVIEVRAVKRSQTCFWPSHHPAGIWHRSAKGQIGADENGIFFLDHGENEYFRSQRFRQERQGFGDYILIDGESGKATPSPIAICDVFYPKPGGPLTSEMVEEVAYERFDFYEEAGRLAFQLHTMAKLGVIIGQPIYRMVLDPNQNDTLDELA